MDKTCKSNGISGVAIHQGFSGARVRNTWATCPEMGDSPPKGGLIPHVATGDIFGTPKMESNLSFPDGPAAYQLVGVGNGPPRL